ATIWHQLTLPGKRIMSNSTKMTRRGRRHSYNMTDHKHLFGSGAAYRPNWPEGADRRSRCPSACIRPHWSVASGRRRAAPNIDYMQLRARSKAKAGTKRRVAQAWIAKRCRCPKSAEMVAGYIPCKL